MGIERVNRDLERAAVCTGKTHEGHVRRAVYPACGPTA